MTNYAKGDRVRVTVEGTVVGAGPDFDGHWVEIRTPGPSYPIRMGFHTAAEGFTVERLSPPPEPLYVNAPEITEPETGDVVRAADDEDDERVWLKRPESEIWYAPYVTVWSLGNLRPRQELPQHLALLVRGGQVWPS